MIKEELKKEAEESVNICTPYHIGSFIQGYNAGAEPREKRIVELEGKLEQTEKDLADYQFNYPTIKELEKENAELKHTIAELRRDKDNLNTHTKAQEKLSEYHSDQLTKAKDLLKKMYYLYFDPCVTHKDLENRDKLLEEVKQLIKEIEK